MAEENNNLNRRSVLKGLGASAVGSASLTAATGTATASDPVEVRIKRDLNTSSNFAENVRDAFNDAASSELSVTVEAQNYGSVTIDTVWDNLYDKKGTDAYNMGSVRGFRHYIADSDYNSWSEGRCYIWLTDFDEWPGDNGDAVGSAFADNLFDHDCTTGSPDWAAAAVDSNRSSFDDVVGTFMHEFGHIAMHGDHNHHQIYDYERSSSGVSTTSCMTIDGDDACTAGEEGSYTNTDFGPTMADCIQALVEYQSPKFEHDAGCQVNDHCADGWLMSSSDADSGDSFGSTSLPVEAEAIVDNVPGEPPAIE